MASGPSTAELGDHFRRALRPPVGEGRFWAVQAMVVALAGLHLVVDLRTAPTGGAFPGGIPVALLVVPVGYAALRYGLAGSVATGLWATVLWLPDLLLPRDEGHVGADLINLVVINGVALFFGARIEAERHARRRVERATAEQLRAETRYRELFEANRTPILVLDAGGVVREANPAARALLGPATVGAPSETLLGGDGPEPDGAVLELGDGHDYRARRTALSTGVGGQTAQVILQDVTEERRRGRQATHYAALVVAAEEDQRRRLARELHDEPLQLFLHLARRLENLGRVAGVPGDVAAGLGEARLQALDAAARLRTMARDLRPPALDQLGLVAALSSFLADVDEETGLAVDLDVSGNPSRLPRNVELGAFRIVQEAVRNTVRHAGADEVRVSVAFGADQLAIEVADDGSGFERDEGGGAGEQQHLGLLGMTERATLLGGSVEVRTADGEGTTVVAVLPRGAPDHNGTA